jgi:hypothetical protein
MTAAKARLMTHQRTRRMRGPEGMTRLMRGPERLLLELQWHICMCDTYIHIVIHIHVDFYALFTCHTACDLQSCIVIICNLFQLQRTLWQFLCQANIKIMRCSKTDKF